MSLPDLTLLPAGAGAGKTHTIQERLTQWVRQGKVAPERIAAVTFTETAATELRERLRIAFMADPAIHLDQVIALDRAYIATIHSFGLRVITEYCFEGGWSPQPRLLNEEEADILVRQALAVTNRADAIMDDLKQFGYAWDYTKGSGEDQFRRQLGDLLQKIRMIGREGADAVLHKKLLDHLHQHYGPASSATTLTAPLKTAANVLLGAFPADLSTLHPGKIRTTTARHDLQRDHQQLTRAATTQALQTDWVLWQRLQTLRITTRTYPLPDGYDELAQNVMTAARQLHRHPGPLHDAIVHAEGLLGASGDALAQHTCLKHNRGLVDYADMLSLANKLLQQQPAVLADLATQLDCIVIDEFQDTNPLSFSLLWTLIETGIPALIVGDRKQAIMGFQDADPRLLQSLETQFPESCTPLTQNWRTTANLMGLINQLGKTLFPKHYHSLTPMAGFVSQLEPVEIIHYRKYAKSHDFFAGHTATVVSQLLHHQNSRIWDKTCNQHRQIKGHDIAVLLPTHTLVDKYATALRALGLQVLTKAAGWFASRSVQLCFYALAYVADRNDQHAALYLSVTELGKTSLEDALKTLINANPLMDSVLATLDPIAQCHPENDVHHIVTTTLAALEMFHRIRTWPNYHQERANLLRLLAEAEAFCQTNPETLAAGGFFGFGLKTFLAWLSARAEADDQSPRSRMVNENAVHVVTWHSAKGREWPVVIVGGTYRSYNPRLPHLATEYQDFANLETILEQARIEFSPEFAAEETRQKFLAPLQVGAKSDAKRLLYVALTRAREKLIIERIGFDEDRPDKQTYWNLLDQETGMAIEDGQIRLGTFSIPCAETHIDGQSVDLNNSAGCTDSMQAQMTWQPIKREIYTGTLTPEVVNPSLLTGAKPGEDVTVETLQYGLPLDIAIDLPAAAAGTVLHRCFEILSTGVDRTHLLEPGTGCSLSATEQQILQNAVEQFEQWLVVRLGSKQLYKEVPLCYQDNRKSMINGMLDVLIATGAGYWILDHKSHKPEDPDVEFNAYWGQLLAYAEGVGKLYGGQKVFGVGVHWVRDGIVTLASW